MSRRNTVNWLTTPLLAILLAGSSMSLTQCTPSPGTDFSADVKEHFGDMVYKRVTFPPKYAYTPGTDLVAAKGSGSVMNRDGRPVGYRWFIVRDGDGEIGDFFFGADDFDSGGDVLMTHGEADRRLKECKKKSGMEYDDCIDQLIDDIYNDCARERMETEECRTHCWFNVCKWCAMDC